MSEKLWILYDGRACGGQGTDDASVLVSCESESEAKSYHGMFGEMACYSYDITARNRWLVNEKWEWDYSDYPASQHHEDARPANVAPTQDHK